MRRVSAVVARFLPHAFIAIQVMQECDSSKPKEEEPESIVMDCLCGGWRPSGSCGLPDLAGICAIDAGIAAISIKRPAVKVEFVLAEIPGQNNELVVDRHIGCSMSAIS